MIVRSFRLSPHLAERLDVRAARLGLTPADFLRVAVVRELERPVPQEAEHVSTD
jgi:predicted DNA-binding protein